MNKKIIGIFCFCVCLLAIFYFKNNSESIDLSSKQAEFDPEVSEIVQYYKVNGLWCNVGKGDGDGVAYKFENSLDDILTAKAKARAKKKADYYHIASDKSKKTKFRILDNGLASFYARLDLIKKAKKILN